MIQILAYLIILMFYFQIREAEQLLKTHQTNKGSMLQGPYQQNQIENV